MPRVAPVTSADFPWKSSMAAEPSHTPPSTARHAVRPQPPGRRCRPPARRGTVARPPPTKERVMDPQITMRGNLVADPTYRATAAGLHSDEVPDRLQRPPLRPRPRNELGQHRPGLHVGRPAGGSSPTTSRSRCARATRCSCTAGCCSRSTTTPRRAAARDATRSTPVGRARTSGATGRADPPDPRVEPDGPRRLPTHRPTRRSTYRPTYRATPVGAGTPTNPWTGRSPCPRSPRR